MPRTPFDPLSGRHLPFDAGTVFHDFLVEEEGAEVLVCVDEDRERGVLIAKPAALRASQFVNAGDRIYTSTGWHSREVRHATRHGPDSAAYWYSERVQPYEVGERITAFRRGRVEAEVGANELEGVDAGPHVLEWEDLNVARRGWDGSRAALVLLEDGNERLVCHEEGAPASAVVWVAKPPRLRRSTYHGKTIAGVNYSSTTTQERQATGSEPAEVQRITPSYVAGELILATRSSFVDPVDGFPYWWEDRGEGREWAMVPEA